MYGAGTPRLLEANGQRAEEKVAIEDLRLATKTVAPALAHLLGQPEGPA
jgi:succinyl-diaminopimelate desuccinylase